MSISPSTINHIQRGHQVIADKTGNVRCATWKDKLTRLVSCKKAASQDKQIANLLLNQLDQSQNTDSYKSTLAAVTQFSKATKGNKKVFKRLENTIFAHKCHQLLSISVNNLIHTDGTEKNSLLPFLKNNFLHYKIAKANDRDKETAILVAGDDIFIRSKKGQCFLHSVEGIDRILLNLPKKHADRAYLKKLRKVLVKKPQSKERIAELQEKLQIAHYTYTPLANVPTDKKGVMISYSFFTEGLESHHVSQWQKVKPTFIEESAEPSYKLRVITRLPEYALKKTWTGFALSILRNLFNFQAHGHTWIELVQPINDRSGHFTGKQKIINMGYYFHPLNSRKRFQNADPMAAMPIPKDQIVVEEYQISKTTFGKGVAYLNQVQTMIRNPKRKFGDVPSDPIFKESDKKKIQSIYQATLKGTCLGFANSFKYALTGIESDNRGMIRSMIMPKWTFKFWDRLNPLMDKSFLLKEILSPIIFLNRMELPYFVKKHVFKTQTS